MRIPIRVRCKRIAANWHAFPELAVISVGDILELVPLGAAPVSGYQLAHKPASAIIASDVELHFEKLY